MIEAKTVEEKAEYISWGLGLVSTVPGLSIAQLDWFFSIFAVVTCAMLLVFTPEALEVLKKYAAVRRIVGFHAFSMLMIGVLIIKYPEQEIGLIFFGLFLTLFTFLFEIPKRLTVELEKEMKRQDKTNGSL